MNWHLISAADLSKQDALLILDTAEELALVADRPIKKLPTLRGRTVVNLFFEDSTRTRISFEAAAKRLSADVINFAVKGSSVAKGESLKDTALTLEAMGADAVVVRHSASGAPHRLSNWLRGSVINAGDGAHEHPTQALLDAFTMRRHLNPGLGKDLSGRRVTIVGDVLHSRVARSNVHLLTTLGAEVRQPGTTLNYLFAPPPNTTFYLEVSGANHSSGMYTLKVFPLHAFDGYEPNDDIFNSRRIEVGRTIEANIMDPEDTDYFSFIAAHTGPVNITIHNRSITLIPALTTYSAEMRNIGFGPDIRTSGAHLRHSFEVVESQMYYLQVWSQNNTAGEYSLTIE